MFTKVLVANRGEIAIRVFRTLREMGIGSVAVYSEATASALRRLRGRGIPDRARPGRQSYLMSETIVRTALRAGAEAVHPGFGFLAENAAFARACAAAGLVFVGPPPDAIESMGSKIGARRLMQEAGVPVIPGTPDPVESASSRARVGRGDRLPDRRQGGGRRRRQGHRGGRRAGRAAPRLRVGPAAGQGVLRRRHGVPRAVPGRPAACRGAGARRRAWNVDPPRRARLHDPAPPPEDHRGDAVPGGRRRPSRADRPDRRGGRARRGVRQRRHRRGPAVRR